MHPLCAREREETHARTWEEGHLRNSRCKGLRQERAWHVKGAARPVLVKGSEQG